MKTLAPHIAVELAQFAYLSKDISKSNVSGIIVPKAIKNHFAFNARRATFHGISGTVAEHTLNHFTGFGFIGKGKPGGAHEGELVLAFRGTACGPDILTDLHCGTTLGPSYHPVHAGFNRTFYSFKKQIESELNKLGPRPVHCVGHSLGGALANLAANWIKKRYSVPVKLYTFGAPRVGWNGFATQSETLLEGVYRAVHRSDPIPMVPVWPFVHAGDEYRLSSSISLTGAAHKLAGNSPGYLNTAGKHCDYSSMAKESAVHLRAVTLSYKDRHHVSFTSYWADRIGCALTTLLKKSGQYSSVLAQIGVGGSLTLVDVLARSLSAIAKASREYAEDARGILGHIFKFCGCVTTAVDKVTYSLAKQALSLMLTALGKSAKQALATIS